MLRPQSIGEPTARPRLRVVPRREPRGIRATDLALAAIFLTFTAFLWVKDTDPDFWWHLRAGQIVVHDGIPRHDPFSWTMAGAPWVAHEWLAEAMIYAVQTTLGYAGNLVVFASAACAAILLMHRLGLRLGAPRGLLLVLTLFATADLARFAAVRPQLFTWVLFAGTVAMLESDDRRPSRAPWVLPPIFAIWANLHLGFYFGFLAVGCWIAAGVYEAVRAGRNDVPRRAAIGLACVLATVLNPHGPDLLVYPLRYVDAPAMQRYIAEWHRPDITNPLHAPIFFWVALLAGSLLLRTRPRPFLVLLAAGVVVLSLDSVRNAPLAALLAPAIAGPAFGARWQRSAGAGAGHTLRLSYPTACVLLGLLAVVLLPIPMTTHGASSLWSPPKDGYPAAGVDYVRVHDAGRRLLNGYGMAGFVIEELTPGTKVFIDGRTDFYGDSFLGEYMALVGADDGWQSTLAKYQPDVVLLPPSTPLVEKLRADPGWRVAYEDGEAVVLERR